MSTTYVAWNGESYRWPPPTGWYKASDDQWWAPGTGPEAIAQVQNLNGSKGLQGAKSLEVSEEEDDLEATQAAIRSAGWPAPIHRSLADILDLHALEQADKENQEHASPTREMALATCAPSLLSEPTVDAPVDIPAEESVDDSADDIVVEPFVNEPTLVQKSPATVDLRERLGDGSRAAAPPPLAEVRSRPAALRRPEPIWEPEPTLAERILQPKTLGILAAVAATLVAILFGVRALSGGQETGQADVRSGSQTSDSTIASDQPGGDPSVTVGAGSPTTAARSTGSTIETTESDDEPSALTPDAANVDILALPPFDVSANQDTVPLVAQYRNLLTAREVTTDQLANDDLVQFANISCAYAAVATTQQEYASTRDAVVDTIDNPELTVDELRFVVDAAVAIFCPEEANRIKLQP